MTYDLMLSKHNTLQIPKLDIISKITMGTKG